MDYVENLNLIFQTLIPYAYPFTLNLKGGKLAKSREIDQGFFGQIKSDIFSWRRIKNSF
jgi:hypothetical protein